MRGWRRGGRKEAENFQNPTDQMRVIEVRVKEDLDRIDNAKLHVTQFRCGAYKQPTNPLRFLLSGGRKWTTYKFSYNFEQILFKHM